MYLIKDNVGVRKILHEEKLLNKNAICHIDDAAALVSETLHSDVVSYLAAELTSHFF